MSEFLNKYFFHLFQKNLSWQAVNSLTYNTKNLVELFFRYLIKSLNVPYRNFHQSVLLLLFCLYSHHYTYIHSHFVYYNIIVKL